MFECLLFTYHYIFHRVNKRYLAMKTSFEDQNRWNDRATASSSTVTGLNKLLALIPLNRANHTYTETKEITQPCSCVPDVTAI